ncbi:MAG: sugar ABC transporter ATP-binding protein [Rikenellaceae bacterium]|nr:sugar ABC transporter ATP-binding protein [Rikenellaceae bacterium]
MINGTSHIILQAQGITKRWPGVLALDSVYFNVYAGQVNAVVGENGAGKSTLMNILSGTYTEYEGRVLLNGEEIRFKNTADAQRAGISMIHQELNLVPCLSVAENIFLGREPQTPFGTIDYREMYRQAEEILDCLQFTEDIRRPVSDLRVGRQQVVEIAKALSFDARVLIMDEPTSSLSENETTLLFKTIASLTAKGVGIVYITHKMDELTQIANRVTVLRDGRFVSESEVSDTPVEEIIRLMVGRERKDLFVKRSHPVGEKRLEARNVCLRSEEGSKHIVKDISFEAHASEVLGIYGLMGAGRTELFETIFGLHGRRGTGTLLIGDRRVMPRNPKEAIGHGIALIPEDRKTDGLVLEMDIARNIALASLDRVLKGGVLHFRGERAQAEGFRRKFDIKSHSVRQKAQELSGGNQQKVVLSKWLLTDPDILLLDEPTRGIDINAKNEIYRLIDHLAGKGMAIVVISSELPEIMAVSDRIITLCEGRLTGEFFREEFSEEKILKASLPEK